MAATGVRRALAKASGAGRHWSSKTADGRCVRRQGRRARGAGRRRRAGAGAAGRARRTGLVPSRPLRHHPDRAAERARPFRRAASARAGGARRRGPAGRRSRSFSNASRRRKAKATRAKPVLELSPFQPVTRDFAFVVDRAVKAADIVRAAQTVDRKLITGVSVFDVYEGQGIEAGKKSVAIAVTIQPREKTMTDQEIDALGGEDRGRGQQAHRRRAARMSTRARRRTRSPSLARRCERAHADSAASIGFGFRV